MPIAAYGSWKSPISSDLIVSNSIRLGADSIGADGGDAGKITADGDILTGAIASNVTNGSGKGGNISLISDRGNIQIDYARSDSTGGKAGNITLDAAKSVRVKDSFSFDDIFYSIYADGLTGNSAVEISYDEATLGQTIASFAVGNADTNGTFGAIANSNYILLPPDSPIALPDTLSVGKLKIWDNQSTMAQLP
ncbi:hypothetical protein, partial [Microcystis sp. M158S2]|uniref:hypothetical protein n=1 Tax=Microcystis sp. M158S2 TaxID=2771152 RepID=UPI002586E3EA